MAKKKKSGKKKPAPAKASKPKAMKPTDKANEVLDAQKRQIKRQLQGLATKRELIDQQEKALLKRLKDLG